MGKYRKKRKRTNFYLKKQFGGSALKPGVSRGIILPFDNTKKDTIIFH